MNEQQNEAVEAARVVLKDYGESSEGFMNACTALGVDYPIDTNGVVTMLTRAGVVLLNELTALRAENAELKELYEGACAAENALIACVKSATARADALAKELEEEEYVSFNNEECARKLENRILELEQQLAAKDAELTDVKAQLQEWKELYEANHG